jgi:replication factor C subunit 2/4
MADFFNLKARQANAAKENASKSAGGSKKEARLQPWVEK